MAVWRHNLRRAECKGMSRSQFQLGDLLIDSDKVDDDNIFPKLKSLVLSNSAVRPRRLLAFIKTHQKTLKKLALTRPSFAPAPELYSQDWSEVASLCKDAVPGLTYLHLSKLVTGRTERFDYDHRNGINTEPTRMGWGCGLEYSMTYECTKGGRTVSTRNLSVSNVPGPAQTTTSSRIAFFQQDLDKSGPQEP